MKNQPTPWSLESEKSWLSTIGNNAPSVKSDKQTLINRYLSVLKDAVQWSDFEKRELVNHCAGLLA